MTTQAERALQCEVQLQLRSWPVISIPVPNSLFIPARTAAEKIMAARIVNQLKANGGLSPGAADLCIFWGNGQGALVELKRPASRDLFGKRSPAGRPSETQKALAERAAELNVRHCYCTSWDEVRDRLTDWGVADPAASTPRAP